MVPSLHLTLWEGNEAFFPKLLRAVRIAVPFFVWEVSGLQAYNYNVSQLRGRVFLRGIHKVCCPTAVPPPLPHFGHVDIRTGLAKLPHYPFNKLSPNWKKNYRSYVKLISEKIKTLSLKTPGCLLTAKGACDMKG
jgi:hypothetical protein